MTAYGQTIPSKWFRDQTPRAMSKINFAHYMHRILMQVGMLPIRMFTALEFALEDAGSAEFPITTNRNDLQWFYDFPSLDTWTIGGVEFRPVLCMYMGSYAGSLSTNDPGSVGNSFCFHLFYRRADRLLYGDLMNRSRLHTSSVPENLAMGNYNSQLSISTPFTPGDESYGARLNFSTWKMHAASADASRPDLLSVQNIHVILGKGGLTVQVGQGTGKEDSASWFSFTLAFGGGRIPGRARVPSSDPNLNLICPIVFMPHQANGGSFYATGESVEGVSLGGVHPVAWLLGVQHDLKIARGNSPYIAANTWPGVVRAPLFNLENIERPLFPILACDTKTSPRQLPSGGAHILQPIVYCTQYLATNGLDFYGPLDPSIRIEPTPSWFDVWMIPKFRFGDRTAPFGEFVDPTSGLNWFVFKSAGLNTMLATEVEGITKYTTAGYFPVGSYTLVDTDWYDFSIGGGGAFPFTWTTSPHAAVAANSAPHVWTIPVPGTDEATLTSIVDGNPSVLTWTVQPYPVIVDSRFTIQMELFWRSDSAQSGQNPMVLQVLASDGATWQTVLTINNVGTTVGPYQDYTLTAEFTLPVVSSNGLLLFRLVTSYTAGAGGTKHGGVRQVKIRTYSLT